jgi:acetyl-CoA carboxylase carboxyl transferase subunit alpha
MRITAGDLLDMGIADLVVPEPEGGAHTDPDTAIGALGDALRGQLAELCRLDTADLLARRYEKYRAIGEFQERQRATLVETDGEGLVFS